MSLDHFNSPEWLPFIIAYCQAIFTACATVLLIARLFYEYSLYGKRRIPVFHPHLRHPLMRPMFLVKTGLKDITLGCSCKGTGS